jgi:hypothetical protein
VCSVELIAYFWEREDASAVVARLGGELRRGRFHGEDDDEDHPWVVVLRDVDRGVADEVVAEYDGWLEPTAAGPAVDGPAAAPPPLPSEPKRFKQH